MDLEIRDSNFAKHLISHKICRHYTTKLTLTYVECDAFDETDVAVLVDCGQVDEPQIAQGGSLRVGGSVAAEVVVVGTANGPPG